ncbi:MAG: hypothetical protein E6K69_04420 [Nitrospirae bacterium]|nr:MAG: hypothetical protein E6K69_04420 [Nitrospirota bacterium]
MRRSLRVALGLFTLGVVASACAQEAFLIRESPSGGVVAYPIHGEMDILSSKARSGAMRLIDEKCQRGYQTIREGEMPRVRKDIDRVWEGQMSGSRLWGLEFICK